MKVEPPKELPFVVVEGAENDSVVPLTTTAVPDGASETVTPLTVMADPPGTSVWLPTRYSSSALPVTVVEPTVNTGAVPGARVSVVPPTTITEPEGASEMGVLFMVIAGPPGRSVCDPITSAEADAGVAVMVCEPIVKTGAAPWLAGGDSEEVCPLTTRADAEGARE